MHSSACSLHGLHAGMAGMDVPGTARSGCGLLHRSRGSASPPAMTGPERGAPSCARASAQVAEHTPVQHERVYLENVYRHAALGIVLSWAVPGQVQPRPCVPACAPADKSVSDMVFCWKVIEQPCKQPLASVVGLSLHAAYALHAAFDGVGAARTVSASAPPDLGPQRRWATSMST